jgi:Holliday junction resolvase RusA-like endonuclease
MKTLKIEIPLPPITKKNHQRILRNNRTGKPFVSPSKQYKDYEENAIWFMPRMRSPIDFPVSVKCLFYVPTFKDCDLPNLLNSIDDILVKAGVLADDSYKFINNHDGSRVLYDKQNPRTEIYIEVVEDMYNTLKEIERNKIKLSQQQYKTLRGQCLAGDVEGALKGLEKLLRRKERKGVKNA